MRCEKVRELAALFAGGDLAARETELVRCHISGCAGCRDLVDEFRGSRAWIRAHRAAELDASKIEQLRQGVWKRIDKKPPQPLLWALIARSWEGLRLGMAQPALALAAVLVFGVAGASLYARRNVETPKDVAAKVASENTAIAKNAQLDSAGDNMIFDDVDSTLAQVSAGEMGNRLMDDGLERDGAGDSLRIEIDTKDPDVRIIWFGARDGETASEN